MGETFTTVINGVQITVWMISLDLWAYTAQSPDTFYRGSIVAMNRIEAINEALVKIGYWKDL